MTLRNANSAWSRTSSLKNAHCNKSKHMSWMNLATHVACLIWSRTLKCSNTLNLQDFHCSVRLILRRQLRKMQNVSNKKRKVSTNYLSGNHRLSVRVHATATPAQAVHVRTERTTVNEPATRRCVSPAPREFARNCSGILVISGCLLLFVFPVRTPAEETCILLFRPLCFVPGSEAVFVALVKHIVALPARSRSSSQF